MQYLSDVKTNKNDSIGNVDQNYVFITFMSFQWKSISVYKTYGISCFSYFWEWRIDIPNTIILKGNESDIMYLRYEDITMHSHYFSACKLLRNS